MQQLRSAPDRVSLAEEQAALRRVATLVAEGTPPNEVLDAVAVEVGRLIGGDLAVLSRFEQGGGVTVLSSRPEGTPQEPPFAAPTIDPESLTAAVMRTSRPARIDDFGEAPGPWSAKALELGRRSAVAAPVTVQGSLWGVMAVVSTDAHAWPPDTEDRLAAFTELLATAIANAESRAELAASEARARDLAEEQAALRRVATLVAEGVAPDDLFAAVAREVANLFGAGGVNIDRYEDGHSVVLATFDDPEFPWPSVIAAMRSKWRVGSRWPLDGGLRTLVYETGRPARLDGVANVVGAPYVADAPPAIAQAWGTRSGVAVPIVVNGEVWGVLGIFSRQDEPLPADTEQRLTAFTELIATSIANFESRGELAASEARARELADEQAALRRVATLVARELGSEEFFSTVAQEVASVLNMPGVIVQRYEADGTVVTIGEAFGSDLARAQRFFAVGSRMPPDPGSLAAQVFDTHRPARIDDFSTLPGTIGDLARAAGLGSGCAGPIVVGGELWGKMCVFSRTGTVLPAGTEDRLSDFIELVAEAIANYESRERVERLAAEQSALRRVATLVARGVPATEIFSAVSKEVGRLFGAEAAIARFGPDGSDVVIVGVTEGLPSVLIGMRVALEDYLVQTVVYRSGSPARTTYDKRALERWATEYETDPWANSARGVHFISSVAAPIIVAGSLWGVITVDGMNRDLPTDTEERLQNFTELVASAIANAENRAELADSEARARKLAEEQAALRRVATLVAQGASPDELFSAVAREVAGIIDLPVAGVHRYEADGTLTVLGLFGETSFTVGGRLPVEDEGIAGMILATGRPSRKDDYRNFPGALGEAIRADGLLPSVGVPIVVEGGIWGFIAAGGAGTPIPADAEQRLARFTELVATAVSNATTRTELLTSRARVVSAADETRRRLERDLHDGIQQWLVALALRARKAASLSEGESEELSSLADDLVAVTDELRELSRGIHPAILSDAGLDDALKALARRSAIPVDLDVSFGGRFDPTLEATMYYVAAESITNAVKHAQASTVRVRGGRRNGVIELEITDDGVGGADQRRGSGLIGLKDRVDTLGGTISIASPAGAGTAIQVTLPAAPEGAAIRLGADSPIAEGVPTRLFGRREELGQLDRLLEELAHGRGGGLVVRGEAGIGKSALLAELSRRAVRRGLRLVTTTGAGSEADLPFAALHALLAPVLDRVGGLPGPQRAAISAAFGATADPAPDRYLIGLAALELLTEMAAEGPILVVIEDAHWLDSESAEVLAFLSRRISLEPVATVFAVRDGVESHIDQLGLEELRLGPLSEENAAELLASVAPDLMADVRAQVLDASAGNPLALIELPKAIRGDDRQGWLLPEPLPLTDRLQHAFSARAGELPRLTQTLLLVAAVNDSGSAGESIAAAQLLSAEVTEEHLAPAVGAGLLRRRGSTLEFRHPLVRSALLEAATSEERRRASAALAEALAADPDRSVWHRAAAADGPDEIVARMLETTAERARRRGAAATAMAAFGRAARLTADGASRGSYLIRAADLALMLGRPNLVLSLLREAEPLDLQPADRTWLLWHLEQVEPRWTGATKVPALVEMAKELSRNGEDLRALKVLADVAFRCWWGNPGQETRQLVIDAAESLGLPPSTPALVYVLGLADPVGQGKRVVEKVTAALSEPDRDPLDSQELGMAGTAVWADNIAAPHLAASASGARAQGRLGLLAQTLVSQAWAALQLGQWDTASTSASEAAALADETAQLRWTVVARLAEAAVAASRGDTNRAHEVIEEAEPPLLASGAGPLLALVQFVRGRSLLAEGRPRDAYDELRRIFEPTEAAFQPLAGVWAAVDLAEAAAQAGAQTEARALLAPIEAFAERSTGALLQASVSVAAALLAADEEIEHRFAGAAISDLSRWPFTRARLLLAQGAWLRRQGQVAASRAPLRAAHAGFHALGALPWSERAVDELRAAGEAPGPRRPDRRLALTAQELQIARMAADGLTNREIGQRLFLSHRTIAAYLSRVYPKLGVTSRAQVRQALDASPSG